MKHVITLCFALLILNYHSISAQCSLAKPDAVVTSWSSCDATVSWNAVSGAAYYEVRYKFKNAIGWNELSNHVTGTSYTFTNLIADSGYKFGVASFCSNGSNSGYKNAQKNLDKITIPTSFAAPTTGGNYIVFSWTEHCPTPSYNLRYRKGTSGAWTTISGIPSTSYTLNNLVANTIYTAQIQSQNNLITSKWTSTLTVNSGAIVIPPPPVTKPNMVVFVLDDGRYDNYAPNGGPSWFTSPSINRIANEGINFVYTFPTTSQCAPSRVSIYSGLYGHHNGCINNSTRHYDGITLVQQILHDAGYYTGFVGKYGQLQGNPVGFDWWVTSDGDIYNNPPYEINGKDTTINGHISDVYQSLALTFLNNVPEGKKFCLMYFTRVPHAPTTPRSQDMNLFTGETMPFPDNFYRYDTNYPSYLYSSGHNWNHTQDETDSVKLNDFRCLYGAEVNMTAILDWLTTKGILDSTLIIFTSDNGYMEGEHKLGEKQLAQEESIRVPMFVRYPAWFTPGQVNTSIMANNIDIAPTLMEAAGIPDTAGMDGTSLWKLYTGEVTRKYFYYQFGGEGSMPPLHAVRSAQYKYVKTYCTQLTEEFYDHAVDPEENINQINNTAYTSLIASYRNVMDSIKQALGDTDPAPVNCYLSNPQFSKEVDEETEEYNVKNVEVYPNPASQYFTIHFNDLEREDIQIWITNLADEKVYYKKMPNSNSFNIIVDGKGWSAGLYLVSVQKGNKFYSTKFTIQ